MYIAREQNGTESRNSIPNKSVGTDAPLTPVERNRTDLYFNDTLPQIVVPLVHALYSLSGVERHAGAHGVMYTTTYQMLIVLFLYFSTQIVLFPSMLTFLFYTTHVFNDELPQIYFPSCPCFIP